MQKAHSGKILKKSMEGSRDLMRDIEVPRTRNIGKALPPWFVEKGKKIVLLELGENSSHR